MRKREKRFLVKIWGLMFLIFASLVAIDGVMYAQTTFMLGTNMAQDTLNGAIDASVVSLDVDSAADFPSTGTFMIRLESEIMKVTGVSSLTFTVVRAQGGTIATSHSDGESVYLVIEWGYISEIQDAVNTVETRVPNAHALGGSSHSDATDTTPAAAHLYLRNVGNTAYENQAMSGDATITAAGVVALAAGSVDDAEIGTVDLDTLDDVNAPAPNDDDALTYDTGTGKWIPEAVATGSPAFDGLSDVTVATPSGGAMALWDGSSLWQDYLMSGDGTLSNAGVLALADGSVSGGPGGVITDQTVTADDLSPSAVFSNEIADNEVKDVDIDNTDDFTMNSLETTASISSLSGSFKSGVADSVRGSFFGHAAAVTWGPAWRWYNAADSDTLADYWQWNLLSGGVVLNTVGGSRGSRSIFIVDDDTGDVYFTYAISVQDITDRSPMFVGDALGLLTSIKPEAGSQVGNWAEVDHATLPAKVNSSKGRRKARDKQTLDVVLMSVARTRSRLEIVEPTPGPDYELIVEGRVRAKMLELYDMIKVQEPGRSLGRMVVINSRAIEQLLTRNNQLAARVAALEAQ